MPLDPPPKLPLIGRSAEITQLSELLGLDDPSTPAGVVVLGGDAGVGKSRLLVELRGRAEAAGHRVLVGHCLDFGESALPYLPFTEMFGRLTVEAPALAESVAAAHPDVRRLMPGMRRLSDQDPSEPLALERGDLFEAVHSALDRLANAAPLVVVIEDLHWADHSTREMLSFLFSRRFTHRVSIVASYRSDDLHRRHPLRAAVGEWSRLPGVTRVQLGPLDDYDVRALVQNLHPAPLPELQLHELVSRAEGNAFFAEELVGAAEVGHGALPDDLADLLLVRLDQLDAARGLAVRASSVAGRRVSHMLLSRVVDLGDADLEGALRVAVERNVMVPVGSDSYAFRHALLAEAVYDDLLPGERVRLHSRYCAVLQSGVVESTAAEVARHALAAHDLPTAVRSSVQAGAEAMSVGGPDEAAQHYQVALELVTQDAAATDGSVDVVDLVARASEAVTAAGHPLRAVELVRDQLDQLPDTAPRSDRVRLLVALATAALLIDIDVDVLGVTTQALGLIESEAATPLRARLFSLHAHANAVRHRDDDAARWAHEALALGRELALPGVVADATTTLTRLDERSKDPELVAPVLVDIIEQARAVGDLTGELRGLHSLGYVHYEHGQLERAQQVYSEAAERARAAGRPWAPYGLDARVLASITAYIRGEWVTAADIADVRGESPPAPAEVALAAAGLMVAAGRGDRSALARLPGIQSWWDRDGMIAVVSGSAAIDLYGDSGDVEAALQVHDELVAAVSHVWQEEHFVARIRLGALAIGQLCAQAGRTSAAELPRLAERGAALLAAAEASADAMRRRDLVLGPEGRSWQARIEAEHARLSWLTGTLAADEEQLVARWQSAVAAFEQFGHVFEIARSKARLAAVLRASGRPEEAHHLVRDARASASRLEAEPLLSELRTLGSSPRAAAAAAGSRRDEALTPREHEILALVATGRTNAGIARQLFISSKTVSVHVSNILAKLGAAGRTEAAAVARRRGLLDD